MSVHCARAGQQALRARQVDPQLILVIPFKEKVKIRGIRFTAEGKADDKTSGESFGSIHSALNMRLPRFG